MRGQLHKIVLVVAVCLPSDRLVFAQAAPTPTVTTTIAPTVAPTSSPGPSPTPSPGPPSMPSGKETVDRQRGADAAFMTRVELRGLEAVELGRIADEHASAASVRAFGRQILQDRGKANEELRLFARGEAISLPAALDASRQGELNRVSRLSSPALDRAIVLAMVRIFEADVADFQKQTERGQEVELQGWVYDTLPLIEEERDEIHRVAAELGISPPRKVLGDLRSVTRRRPEAAGGKTTGTRGPDPGRARPDNGRGGVPARARARAGARGVATRGARGCHRRRLSSGWTSGPARRYSPARCERIAARSSRPRASGGRSQRPGTQSHRPPPQCQKPLTRT